MRRWLRVFCANDDGTLFTIEWVYVATLLVLGAATCLVAVRQHYFHHIPAARVSVE